METQRRAEWRKGWQGVVFAKEPSYRKVGIQGGRTARITLSGDRMPDVVGPGAHPEEWFSYFLS